MISKVKMLEILKLLRLIHKSIKKGNLFCLNAKIIVKRPISTLVMMKTLMKNKGKINFNL